MPQSNLLAPFLAKYIGDGPFELMPCQGGKNNQCYQVKQAEKSYFLKCFFAIPSGVFPKLKAEYDFLKYLQQQGTHQVAKPIAVDFNHGYLLTEFINGRGITQDDIHADREGNYIQQCIDFIVSINSEISQSVGNGNNTRIGESSDAINNIDDAIQIVSKRLFRLKNAINKQNLVSQECAEFIANVLSAKFVEINQSLNENSRHKPLNADCMSPSDFGFHNAMLMGKKAGSDTSIEKLAFFDFEYAGRDSKYKLVADFFCQPRYPVDISYLSLFIQHPYFQCLLDEPDVFLQILALTQLKWNLILLNEFIPEIASRREFSGQDKNEILQIQLQRSKEYFSLSEQRLLCAKQIMSKLNVTNLVTNEVTFRCIVCGASNVELVYHSKDKHSVASDCRPLAFNIVIYQCQTCGHYQKNNNNDYQKNVEEIYKSYQAYQLTKGKEQLNFSADVPSSRCQVILSHCQPLLPVSGKMLDVGAGSGVMLCAMNALKGNWQLYAQDVSAHHAQMLIKTYKLIDFYQGDFQQIKEQFDLITLVHVLEHVWQVESLLLALKSKLSATGKIIFQVPNIDENEWDFAIYDHVSHFSKATLSQLILKYFPFVYWPKKQIDKELTVVASLTELSQCSNLDNNQINASKTFAVHKKCIAHFESNERHLLDIKQQAVNYVAVLGTGPSASYAGCLLGSKMSCWLDEDKAKIGQLFCGYPVKSLSAIAKDELIVLPYPEVQSSRIKKRLSDYRFY